MNETTEIRDHSELEMLLPWYVNGTLDVDRRANLQQHLDNCSECRDNVTLLERMQSAVRNESPSPIVPQQDVQGLLDQLDSDDARKSDPFGWITPRVAAAVAAIVVLGFALLLVEQDPAPQVPQIFETATATNSVAATGYVLAVQFEPETTTERQQELIAAMGGTSIGAGEQPYTLQVAVSPPADSLEELAEFTREVGASPEIVSVVVVAVQLPVAK